MLRWKPVKDMSKLTDQTHLSLLCFGQQVSGTMRKDFFRMHMFKKQFLTAFVRGKKWVPELAEALSQLPAWIAWSPTCLTLSSHICLQHQQPKPQITQLSSSADRIPVHAYRGKPITTVGITTFPYFPACQCVTSPLPDSLVWWIWSSNCILSLYLPAIGNRIDWLEDRLWIGNCFS